MQTLAVRDQPIDLGYERTVDRRSVHRWSISEVFLTDVQTDADGLFLAAAQLPTSHSYYGDDTTAEDTVDSMLLMECFRQAATWIAHHRLNVPVDASFLVTDWTLRLEPARRLRSGHRPGRLRMSIAVAAQLSRGGTMRGAKFVGQLELDGESIGESTVSARYIPADEAATVRAYHRGSDPIQSTSLPSRPLGRAVSAGLVGRSRADNVVLFDVAADPSRLVAQLGTRPSHRGFYDHPQDHYTAMILFEGARQLALLGHGLDRPAASTRLPWISGLAGRFHYFAELDAPVQLEARTDARAIDVLVSQQNRTVAQLTVHLTEDGSDD